MLLVYVAILLGYCATCLSSASQVEIHEAERAPSSRDQLLKDYYTNPHTGGSEELASFFSISEMYRLGPPRWSGIIEHNRKRCQEMVDRLNTNRQSGDYCHWTYTCNYNANRFPSMIINATECTAVEGAICIQRVNQMQTFSRTFVDIAVTWRKDDIPASVVYAYTCRMR